MTITIVPVHLDAEVVEGDDIAAMILGAAPPLLDGDVVVVTQKVVSKAEGQVVELSTVTPSARARELSGGGADARVTEVILRESRRVVRHRAPLLITETHHGFVCANGGVDRSNAPRPDTVVLLPRDPDASAGRIRASLEAATGRRLVVIVADTMGRPLREGIVGTAIGVSGMAPLLDLAGQVDPNDYRLGTTVIALADELAAAADLALGKLDRVPVAVIRGHPVAGDGSGRELIRDPSRDLFV